MSNTNSNVDIVEWNKVNWRKVQKAVFKLQKRIYRAFINSDVRKGRRLQKTLIKSYYNKLLATRKVTQDNQGKKTAGVDKVKSLNPKQRFELAKSLKLGTKSKPIRRVWIPKPGKNEMRPLGIPVMRDRALQSLIKNALEPEWEARFEPNSYGFRPGRSAHDAIEAIFHSIKFKPKYVLDADIAKCFDRINHAKLLEKINTFPSCRRQVRAWLKADILDFVKHERTSNHEGTPQGGVISPLLSNIALHGMEHEIKRFARTWKGKKLQNEKSISLIRYADDFVIIHENLEVIKQCQKIISKWLSDYDLEIKPEKTRVCHTLLAFNDKEKPGFNFLGFNIRQYPVGKHQTGKVKGKPLGYKTLIKPSDESKKRHLSQIAEICKNHNSAPQQALISKLNPVIRGWCNYYRTVVSKETFSKLQHLTYLRLERWANRRHPNKSKSWVKAKYWKTIGMRNWVFSDKEYTLIIHSDTAIKRHTKVRGEKSPYDGDTLYWVKRKGTHPELPDSIAKLLKKQKGKCNWCNLTFQEEDTIEKDHIIPKSLGGSNTKENYQLLHKHCHDSKTALDLANIKRQKESKVEGTHTEPGKREAV